ncbi:tyrosine-type recombinase/integrase [Paracoccus niistensis]|uniref:Tyrosine-type recombinase/integrase n=1 Tax=Paracoccus niistensis TaxID=632935 RepID=A0ABV6I4Z8_9RHOB
MTYPHSPSNGTHDLLARITRDQAAKLPGPALEMTPATTSPATVGKARDATMKATKKKEPNTTVIQNSDGTTSYRVQIRGRVHGKQHSLCRTFSTLTLARAWRKRTTAEIELNGFPAPETEQAAPTVADIIHARLDKDKKIERSAKQYLRYLSKHPLWISKRCSDLTVADLVDFAELMVSEDREPQTVAGYMSLLSTTLKRARKRGAHIPPQVVEDGMDILWEEHIIARSSKRDRRPTLDELDKILSAAEANKRQKLPLAKLIVFAIFSTRRLGEICRLRWCDLNEVESKILVRDMKHPRKKKGNNVTVTLPDEAMRIIRSMPREGAFIFPFNPRSVGTAFRRQRDIIPIVDLRFHDLRHEGISWLFEMGETDYFVRQISGHEPGGCLARYAHVRNKGNKFANWCWLDRVIHGICA